VTIIPTVRFFISRLLLLACLFAGQALAKDDALFSTRVQALNAKDFRAKQEAVAELLAVEHPRTLAVAQALLNGNLYYRKSDKQVFIVDDTEGGYQLVDPLSGDQAEILGKRKVKKIGINNKLRRLLKNGIARLSLQNPDADVRLASVRQMYSRMDADSAQQLAALREVESDPDVIDAIDIALALEGLASADERQRLDAIQRLSGSLEPEARNRLRAMLGKNVDGEFLESSTEVRKAAKRALTKLEGKRHLNKLAETLFFGLSLGSVLLLAAIGLAITFGVMGVINMAHGELMMLGAYTTYLVQQMMPAHLGASLLVAVPAAFLVAAAFGIAIERGIIRHLYGRPLETLLATFGLSLVLQQLVRTTISAQNVIVSNPAWMSGSLEINPALSLTYNRLYVIVFSLIVFGLLMLVLKRTSLGLQVRAVAQNRSMARAIGIRSDWVDAMTFGLGSGIAGVAGVALSQLTNVGPNMGQAYIIDSFMVVVFGGVGNLWGTLVGAMSLGVANKFLEPYSGAVLAKILVLVFIILFIQKRPRGLFPQRGRAAEG
jgi:urea transport system permease protein